MYAQPINHCHRSTTMVSELYYCTVRPHLNENLRAGSRPHRHHHASPWLELPHELFGYPLGRGADVYGIERAMLRPTLPPIAGLRRFWLI